MTDGPKHRKPAYGLDEVDEVPDPVDLRRVTAPLRLLVTKVISKKRPGKAFRIAQYAGPEGANKARQRFNKEYPELAAQVDLESRVVTVEVEGEEQTGSALYVTYNPPQS